MNVEKAPDWLWNDRWWIEKREREQWGKLLQIRFQRAGKIFDAAETLRYEERYESVSYQWERFKKRLEELDALRTKEERG